MTITVLIVDDSAEDQRLYNRVLKDSGYQLKGVFSGEDGIASLLENSPDLLLLDYILPDMDGLNFIKSLREKLEIQFPVVMLTGEGSEAVAVEAMKIGIQDYIVKDTSGGFLKLLPSVIKRVLQAHAERVAAHELKVLHDRILHSVADGVIGFDHEGVILFSNHSAERMMSCQTNGLIGLNLSQVLFRNGKPFSAKNNPLINGVQEPDTDLQLFVHEGKSFPISLTASPLESSQEGSAGWVIVFQDITAQKLYEQELRISAVTFNSTDAIVITDAEANIIKVNHAFTTISGYSPEEVLGKNPRMMSSGKHDKAFFTHLFEKVLHDGAWEGEIWDRRKNGEIYPRSMTISVVKDANQKISQFVGIFRDITERKKNEELISKLAFYDPLTQLPNRRLLTDRLGPAMASNKRHGLFGAVLFMDLDKFKPLNDTYGHSVGDLLLIEVGRRIMSCVREADTVARFGGDEFVVMLTELSSDEAKAREEARIVAEKIRLSLIDTFVLNFKKSDDVQTIVEHNCSSSIGVTLFHGQEKSQEEILKQADDAMYRAKEDGRNLVRFYEAKIN